MTPSETVWYLTEVAAATVLGVVAAIILAYGIARAISLARHRSKLEGIKQTLKFLKGAEDGKE